MTVFQSIILGILQGVAEFLPISSSGHLQLAQSLFNLDEVPLLFDVFLHLSTLAAVCIFFWKKIWALLKCFGRWITKNNAFLDELPNADENDILCKNDRAGRKTIIAIIIATFITGVMGIIASKLMPQLNVKFVCVGFLVTSLLLIISSLLEKKQCAKVDDEKKDCDKNEGVSMLQSIVIGVMQGFGTLPGISRSGSTISGALFSKVNRKAAGDFSFIVSIPAILGAFILELKDLGEVTSSIGVVPLIAGCLASFVVGYFSLSLLMKLIRKGKLAWFAAYLIPVAILGFIFLK